MNASIMKILLFIFEVHIRSPFEILWKGFVISKGKLIIVQPYDNLDLRFMDNSVVLVNFTLTYSSKKKSESLYRLTVRCFFCFSFAKNPLLIICLTINVS